METILNQPIAGTPLKVRDLIDKEKLRAQILQNQTRLREQQPEEIVVQPQDKRISARKRLFERSKSVANRVLKESKMPRSGRQVGKMFSEVGGKSNADALIILMGMRVNAALEQQGTADGSRGEASLPALENVFMRLDAIGDSLVKEIQKQ